MNHTFQYIEGEVQTDALNESDFPMLHERKGHPNDFPVQYARERLGLGC